MTLEVETLVNECYIGLFGFFTDNDTSDCFWRRYQPQLPLWEFSLLNRGDNVYDYVPWNCSDGGQLETTDRIDANGDGIPDDNVNGFEPSNIDDGDMWEFEGTTIVTE